jgi:hypothetical protein
MKKLALFGLLTASLLADGWFDPSPDYYIEQQAQVAIVKHVAGKEELIIDVKFYGNSKDFAWVIPTPALPAVDSVPVQLFYDLQDFCRPIYKQRGSGCSGILGGYPTGENGKGDSETREVGQGVIGGFAYKIIEAQSVDGLSQYLTDNGYAYPNEAPPVLNSYLNKDWHYFLVARTDTATMTVTGEVGVRITFASAAPVYPMKITSLSSDSTDVILYVVTEHRMHAPGAALKFAGWIGAADLNNVSPVIDRTYFLTKLYRRFTKDMEDITLTRAPDDQEYREIIFYAYSDKGWGDLSLFAAVGIVLFLKRRWRK